VLGKQIPNTLDEINQLESRIKQMSLSIDEIELGLANI